MLPSGNALLAPPGVRIVACKPRFAPLGTGVPLSMMIPATGSTPTLAWVPPHSGPQLKTKAVLPSEEKTAFNGSIKLDRAIRSVCHRYDAVNRQVLRFAVLRIGGAGWLACRCRIL